VQPASWTPSSDDLRVMSFNLRIPLLLDGLNYWSLRREQVVQTIRDFDPDIVGTQECVAEQADYLRAAMPGYGFVGVGRDDGMRRGEMCAVFYKAERFDVVDAGHFWLSPTPERPGSRGWGSLFPRMVTWVKLRPRTGEPDLCVFNTHFAHSRFNGRARRESARLLRERIDSIAGPMPVIVTGDFNTGPDTSPHAMLASSESSSPMLVDTFRVMHPGGPARDEGTLHGFSGHRSGPRIDWILASNAFETFDAQIDRSRPEGRFPSDHFPVTAVLRPALALPIARIE
jgi:endonuclease/exonuclease/phosphatase family metal-dependent hydrolase